MKHECDVVRDLMPMCMDETASEKSRRMVEEHVAQCRPCGIMYQEMKGEANLEMPVQQEAPEFTNTVKKLRRCRKRRKWLTLLAGVLLTMAAALLCVCGYFWYFEEEVLVEPQAMQVVVTGDDLALIRAVSVPAGADLELRLASLSGGAAPREGYEVRAYLTATRYQRDHQERVDYYFSFAGWEDGLYMNLGGKERYICRITEGRSDGAGRVFYLADDDRPQEASLLGMNLKSPAAAYLTSDGGAHPVVNGMPLNPDGSVLMGFVTPAPTPQGDGDPGLTVPQPTALPEAEGFRMFSPTPTPGPTEMITATPTPQIP